MLTFAEQRVEARKIPTTLSHPSTSAPLANKSRTTSSCPSAAAVCNGAQPSPSGASASPGAATASRSRTTVARPAAAAK
ncbi:unnamed protein product [Acanthoscelides obtectus]|uniref:Uncharacterized protein n=1 Tax=Acanthoscelides obtectus TaxID=200917 RepID=A0A9P0QHC5_ACAOB|nr:unnamed protein product [Acanthoscelides obtectus]CAK1683433.1 hypothetical protein AOBTE_LOCUS34241 [Acanthoscelides obtectus]